MGGQIVQALGGGTVRRRFESVVEVGRWDGLIVERGLHRTPRSIDPRRERDPVGDPIRPLAVLVVRVAVYVLGVSRSEVPAIERRVQPMGSSRLSLTIWSRRMKLVVNRPSAFVFSSS